jgi:hypothetical protein
LDIDEVLSDFNNGQPFGDVSEALQNGMINVCEVLDSSLTKYINRHSGGEPIKNLQQMDSSKNENL